MTEGAQDMTEEVLLLLVSDAKHRENLRLEIPLVDSDTPPADLDAGKHDVVSLGTDLREFRGIVEQVPVFRLGSGEGMVDGMPALLLDAVVKKRKVDNPEEVQEIAVDRDFLERGDMETDTPQNDAGGLPVIGTEKDEIALLHAETLGKGGFLGLREKLHDRRLPLTVLDLDEGEPLRSRTLGKLSEFLDLTCGDAGKSLRVHRLDHAARIESRTENLKLALRENVADVLQLHAETGIGLITAESVHGHRVRHAWERHRDFHTTRLAEDTLEHRFDEMEKVVRLHEGSLDINLRELRLAVGAQILVAETTGDLEVLVDTADHQHLLILLGCLRKRVEAPGRHARRDQEVARTLRGALGKDRGLDLPEPLGVEHVADRLRDAVAQTQVLSHRGTAEIKEAVGETQILVGDPLVHREGGNLRAVQYGQRRDNDLDGTGGEFRILGSLESGGDLADNRDHILRAERMGGGSRLPV